MVTRIHQRQPHQGPSAQRSTTTGGAHLESRNPGLVLAVPCHARFWPLPGSGVSSKQWKAGPGSELCRGRKRGDGRGGRGLHSCHLLLQELTPRAGQFQACSMGRIADSAQGAQWLPLAPATPHALAWGEAVRKLGHLLPQNADCDAEACLERQRATVKGYHGLESLEIPCGRQFCKAATWPHPLAASV